MQILRVIVGFTIGTVFVGLAAFTANAETLDEAWAAALAVDPELQASRWQSSVQDCDWSS